jgi:hypothetical protein
MTATELHTRAMLVSLRISSWGATRQDNDASAEVAKLYGAKSDSGKYVKRLMPKGKNAYQDLQGHIAAMRILCYGQTLPWSDDGWRMLPIKNHAQFTGAMRNGFHVYDSMLATLVREYPVLKAQAIQEATEEAVRTGNPRRLLKDSDFPLDIRGEYGWAIEYNPVPAATDFRVSLPADEINAIAARTEERVRQAFQAAMTGKDGAVTRLYDVVSRIQAKLAEPDGIFRDTLIGNARELCDILTRLNVTDDSKLEQFRRQTEVLAASEPQTLRENPDVRIDTARQAQSILDAMSTTYGKSIFA